MARPRTNDLDTLLDVAEQLATAGDPSGLTLRRLAVEAGASNGSIYHAFTSKEELLAKVWIRAARRLLTEQHERIASAIDGAPTESQADDAVVVAALWPVEFATHNPSAARLFFGQRRDQLFSDDDLSPAVKEELDAIQAAFTQVLIMLARARWNRTDRIAVETIAACVVDLPGGLMQRKLATGAALDAQVAAQVEAACRAILALAPPPPPTRKSRTTREKEARP
ncbi:MAG TPA: TetR family transcriptional regulator [Nocardioidaceae bacterium]|nr:TetR family transcriptional regulator [Nocardioidaceae bacterium]